MNHKGSPFFVFCVVLESKVPILDLKWPHFHVPFDQRHWRPAGNFGRKTRAVKNVRNFRRRTHLKKARHQEALDLLWCSIKSWRFRNYSIFCVFLKNLAGRTDKQESYSSVCAHLSLWMLLPEDRGSQTRLQSLQVVFSQISLYPRPAYRPHLWCKGVPSLSFNQFVCLLLRLVRCNLAFQ